MNQKANQKRCGNSAMPSLVRPKERQVNFNMTSIEVNDSGAIKAIEEYKTIDWNKREASVKAADMIALLEYSNHNLYEASLNAWEAGFMMGYRKAQRDMKRGVSK